MLVDVVIIRLSLIILLVLYHAFCIFSGAWQVPDGYPQIPAYWWIAKTAYCFMLEAFVFISGYLYGYQVQKKGLHLISFKSTVLRKAKRLLLPCLFFGIVYYWMFYDWHKPFYEIGYILLNGAGHLWFLPMLFWCFVCVYVIEKINISLKVVLPLSFILALCSFVPLPFRLTNVMYYFFFFYVGYCINRYKWNVERLFTVRNTVALGGLWLFSFVVLTVFNNFGEGNDSLAKVFPLIGIKLSKLCYSSLGLAMFFGGVNFLCQNKKFGVTPWMIKTSHLCFGVYIYQQFILRIIYYQLGGLDLVPPSLLPWIGFFLTLFLSLLLSYATLKTRLGRFLVG